MRILVVDDVPMYRTMLSTLLERWGHEVVVADTGVAAWEILLRERIKFVITDWMMPEMDGIGLCHKIRSGRLPYYVYIVLLTAKDSKADLVAGMDAGADDFVSKPFNVEELRARVRAGQRIIQLRDGLVERNQRLHKAYDSIRKDLEAAARVQRSLLPDTATTLNDIRIDWLFKPATYVAGDIFNYFRIDSHRLGFYHLDVAGHGVRSALLSVSLSRFLGAEVCLGNDDPQPDGEAAGLDTLAARVVRRLNQDFQDSGDDMLYFTMVLGIYDDRSEQTALCLAGHPHPILLTPGRKAIETGSPGFPVGMLPDVDYSANLLAMTPGSRLFMFSDGITECENPVGIRFGTEYLLRLLEETRRLPLKEVMETLQQRLLEWRGSDAFDDDVSGLVLERQ